MKFFAIFAAVLAVACASQKLLTIHELSEAIQNPQTDPAMLPYLQAALNELMLESMVGPQPAPALEISTWTLHELSTALQNPNTNAALLPFLEAALNDMMASIMTGQHQDTIVIATPVGLLPVESLVPVNPAMEHSTWTLHELSTAIQSPNTDAALLPFLEAALNDMMASIMTGQPQESIVIATPVGLLPVESLVPVNPAMEHSTWTLHELSNAIQNPNTDAALLPFLEAALNDMMASIMTGQPQESIVIATPVGLLPVNPTPVEIPTPVVVPTPVETPVVTPVEASAASPLVQIIVNIKQQSVAAPAPVVNPSPVVVPSPVIIPGPVRPEPENFVPVNPVDVIAITPPEAIINPVDVIAITPPEAVVNPVDVVAISPPEVIINPIDVIAISAPEVNPIDIASPIPVVPVGVAGVVGPIL